MTSLLGLASVCQDSSLIDRGVELPNVVWWKPHSTVEKCLWSVHLPTPDRIVSTQGSPVAALVPIHVSLVSCKTVPTIWHGSDAK